ncbi:MAG: hypothetical protein NTX72_01190 [Candidatus Uhrbacteria bacterium]|nr:hypothetical protein [Candidatus Uhrbacteria bacterium]
MKNFGAFIGAIGGASAAGLWHHFNPDTGFGVLLLCSMVGGGVVAIMWLALVYHLNIPQVPKPSRAELFEATRVELERQIAEATEACGSEHADAVYDLRKELNAFNYLSDRLSF